MSVSALSFLDLGDSSAVVYHNNRCSKSRAALAYLADAAPDLEVRVINYLDTPPTKEELRALIAAMGVPTIKAMRTGEKEFKELELSADSPEEALLDAMVARPRLIERPIVVTAKGVRIARPTEAIEEIL